MEATEFLERIRLATRRQRPHRSTITEPPVAVEPRPRGEDSEHTPAADEPGDAESPPFALAHQMVAALAEERGEALRIVELRMVPVEGAWGVVAVVEPEAPESGADDLGGIIAGLRDVAEPAPAPPSPAMPLAEELLALIDQGVVTGMILDVDGDEELVGDDAPMLGKLRALAAGVPVPGRLAVDTDQGSYRVLRQPGLDLAVALVSEQHGDVVDAWFDGVAAGAAVPDLTPGDNGQAAR